MSVSVELSVEGKSLLEVAVESWRFARLFARLVTKLDAGEKARFEGQLRWHLKKLDEHLQAAGLKLVNIEGACYEPGLAATAINGADFGPEDVLYVDQMVEPIIMGPSGLLRSGTILLRKADL
jgi:hypothetical protein